MSENDIGKEVYSGAAEFGRIRAAIGFVVGVIVGTIFIIGGVALIKKKVKLTGKVQGTVTNHPSCTLHQDDQDQSLFKCLDVNIKYTVGDKDYNITVQTDSSTKYSNNTTMNVYFNPSNPGNGQLLSDDMHVLGWVGLVLGIILVIGSSVQLWLSRKYKFVAAAQGVGGAISIAENIF
jgi:hypothetical protein